MPDAIVITSIFPASPSVRKWASIDNWQVVVAGDLKTPQDWSCPPAIYLSVDDQNRSGFQIAGMLPWNHYARKLLGYLVAIQLGAEIIVDTDDDNMPKSSWSIPSFQGKYLHSLPGMGFMNIYSYFTDQHIWPRGFPLERISHPAARLSAHDLQPAQVRVGIWQGLADGDPDVDAIYRMTVNAQCVFDDMPPVVLNSGTLSPFNSQNTAFIKEVFPLLYLPSSVSFRSTDIIRGLVAQPILWSAGYSLGFAGATVIQHRNAHDGLSDFQSEIPCYLYSDKIVNLVIGGVSSRFSIETNLVVAYEKLIQHNLVQKNEMKLISAWIKDIQNLTGRPS